MAPSEPLNLRLPPDVAALLSDAHGRVGPLVARHRLAVAALAIGLRAVVRDPAVLFATEPHTVEGSVTAPHAATQTGRAGLETSTPPTATPSPARAKTPPRRSSKTSTRPPSPAQATPAPAPSKDPPTEPRGRWVKVSAADLAQLARELKALSPEELRACIDGAGLGRSAVYAARGGKAGEPVYRALRAWLDARKR